MDFNSWIGLTVGAVCAIMAHFMGRRSGKSALQNDIKIRLKQIQNEAEIETGEIVDHGDREIKSISKTGNSIRSADSATIVDEFNDAFSGE